MANMIKELWYGNIIPQENGIFSKPQFKELLGYMARHRAELEETLTDKQKELLDKMMDNRDYKADGYACGRVTMQGSFCGTDSPDLSAYKPVIHDTGLKMDYIVDDLSGFYAVAFDSHGRLVWKSNRIDDADKDPGYDKAQIIEVLTEQVDERYLAYLESLEIPYIFAGKTEIDVELALFKLKNIIGINTLLLEGGNIVNGGFAEANVIDELSLVIAPIVADTEDKPLFMKSKMSEYKLAEVKQYDGGVLWLNHKK